MPTKPLTKQRTILSAPEMRTLDAIWHLEKVILNTLDFHQVVQKVVDSILLELGYLELGYRVVVLALLDDDGKTLRRVSLSGTKEALQTREVSEVAFKDIVIPMTATENLCIKAVLENKPQITHSFPDILSPPLTPENALESQKNAGIQTSLVYPVRVKGKVIGILIFSMKKSELEVTEEEKKLIQYFTDLVGLAVQNARLYSDLEKANQRLEELDKTKDEFISITSHELRTPMTAIKGFLWMLEKKGGELSEKQKRYIGKAQGGVTRMLALINDMLDVSRIEEGRIKLERQELDLGEVMKRVVDELKVPAEEKQLALDYVAPVEGLPSVFGDPNKTHQVLVNLIGNAIKYTDQGSVTVRAEVGDEVKVVKISVKDTGRGISRADLPRLFRKFGRLDSSFVTVAEAEGTGLGLYITKSLVEQQGGEIGVESEVGKGSTFWFTLPVYVGGDGE